MQSCSCSTEQWSREFWGVFSCRYLIPVRESLVTVNSPLTPQTFQLSRHHLVMVKFLSLESVSFLFLVEVILIL